MTSLARLSATTPFLIGVPNSLISPEWFRVLSNMVQVLGGGNNVQDISSLENFVFSELPIIPDASIADLQRSVIEISTILNSIIEDYGSARKSDLDSHWLDNSSSVQETLSAFYRAAKSLQDAIVDQLTSPDVIRSMASQDSGSVKITGGSIDGVSFGGTSPVSGAFSSILFKGSSSGSTTLQANATASGTLTLPAATDTLIGKATADVLTNKTLDTAGAGNVFKINGTGISSVTGSGAAVLANAPVFTGAPGINLNAASPQTALSGTGFQITGLDSTQTRLLIDTFGSNGQISFRRADGTNASPSAIQLNDSIGNIASFGRGATSYSSSSRASITFAAAEAWTDSAQGTSVNIGATLTGTTTNTVRINIDGSGNIIAIGGAADQGYSYQTPATGFSITIGAQIQTLILDPAGTLATGTITMPASPVDGQTIRITSTQNITALTVSANTGQSIKNAPTAFTVSLTGDQGFEFIYRTTNTTWYRLQ